MVSTFADSRSTADIEPGAEARRDAFVKARTRWTGFELTYEQFTAHLERLGCAPVPRQVEPLYLCAACTLGSEVACSALEREYFPAVRSGLSQRYRRKDFVDDVLQQTRERLMVGPSPRIASYRGDGSLPAWLRRVAAHVAIDLRRIDGPAPLQFVEWQRHQAKLAIDASWGASWDTSWPTGNASGVAPAWARWLEHALSDALGSLDASQKSLLRMFYVQGAKIEEISLCYGIDRSTAYRQLRRAEQRVRRDIFDAVRKKTGLSSADELSALLRPACDQVNVAPNVWDMPAG